MWYFIKGILKALPAEACIATSLSGAEPLWATIIPFALIHKHFL